MLVRQLVEQVEDRDAKAPVEEVIDYFTPTSATDAITRRIRRLSPNTLDVLTPRRPAPAERDRATLAGPRPDSRSATALGQGRRKASSRCAASVASSRTRCIRRR